MGLASYFNKARQSFKTGSIVLKHHVKNLHGLVQHHLPNIQKALSIAGDVGRALTQSQHLNDEQKALVRKGTQFASDARHHISQGADALSGFNERVQTL